MGTLAKVDYFERVEIVLNPDGSFKGAFAAALRGVSEDGVLLPGAAYVNVHLSEGDLSRVLPDEAAMLAQLEAARVSLALAEQTIAALNEQVAETKAALEKALSDRAD